MLETLFIFNLVQLANTNELHRSSTAKRREVPACGVNKIEATINWLATCIV